MTVGGANITEPCWLTFVVAISLPSDLEGLVLTVHTYLRHIDVRISRIIYPIYALGQKRALKKKFLLSCPPITALIRAVEP